MDKYNQLTSHLYFHRIPKHLRSLNPSEIRREMEYLFRSINLFKQNILGDPSDVFYVFMSAIHAYCKGENSLLAHDDCECTLNNCNAHQCFYINYAEQIECLNCKEKSGIIKYPSFTFLYDIHTKQILDKIDKMQYLSKFNSKLFSFAKEFSSTNIKKEDNKCPNNCANPSLIKQSILIKPSSYFAFTLTWESNLKPKLSDICKFIFTIPETIYNNDLFEVYDPMDVKKYFLYGMICFCDDHYICFFLCSDITKSYWVYHNDMEIHKMETYKDVITFCIMNRYYPKMLFYKEYTDKTSHEYDIKLTEFHDGDFFCMFNHSLKVDRENALSYENELSPKGRIRPMNKAKKTNDENLIKTLTAMKQKNEKKKKPTTFEHYYDDDDDYNDDDDVDSNFNGDNYMKHDKGVTSHGTIDEAIGKKQTKMMSAVNEDVAPVKKQPIIDEEKLNTETFRNMPYERQGEWVCKNVNCKNINNSSSFECVKCKMVDMDVLDKFEAGKGSTFHSVMVVKHDRSKNGSAVATKNKKMFYWYDMNGVKKCINCKRPFNNKCEYCEGDSQTYQMIRDENYGRKIGRKGDNVKGVGNGVRKGAMWKCGYCETNNMYGDFCRGCKKNRK